MRFMLPSRLIGTVSAVAIAMTSLIAAPAHADDRQAARIAAALLGLAVVGAIINENKKDKRDDHVVHRQPTQNKAHKTYRQREQKRVYNQHQNGRVQQYGHVQPRPLPQRVDRKLLPQNCFRSFETRQGTTHMFGRRCLERNYRAAHRLPQSCAITVRTYDGRRSGYDARCLRRNGYSLARG